MWKPEIVTGKLLDQDTEVIVNAWNRNVFPWWLLIPQGVSRAIRKTAGTAPFRELARMPPIPLGGAVVTSAGNSNFQAIIHVAGINVLWFASEKSIRGSIRSAVQLAQKLEYKSIALPLIGAGSGSFNEAKAMRLILEELEELQPTLRVVVVQYSAS